MKNVKIIIESAENGFVISIERKFAISEVLKYFDVEKIFSGQLEKDTIDGEIKKAMSMVNGLGKKKILCQEENEVIQLISEELSRNSIDIYKKVNSNVARRIRK